MMNRHLIAAGNSKYFEVEKFDESDKVNSF